MVPRADRHQNEYVPENEERIAYLTGFTGSAGFLLVLADKAVLFTDGRYTLQAREQTDPAIFTLVNSVETAPSSLDRAEPVPRARGSATIPGFTPPRAPSGWRKPAARPAPCSCRSHDNPVDEIWTDRPAPPLGRDRAA